MERLTGFARRFRFPWRSAAQIRRDIEDELAFHVAAKTEALQRWPLGYPSRKRCESSRAQHYATSNGASFTTRSAAMSAWRARANRALVVGHHDGHVTVAGRSRNH